MLKNLFKTAYRNLSKNKFFTVLNVLGLALGMSLSLLFIALLSFLSRYDNFHPHKERIYRVITQVHDKVENPRFASAPVGLADHLENNFSGIENVVRVHRSLYGDAVYGEKKIRLGGYFADPAFFEVFNFPLLKGDKTTALTNPNSIVISETEARKIFGEKEAIGEMIRMEGYGNFVVTGILKDLPVNSHMQFGAIASFATIISDKGTSFLQREEGWRSFENSFVYLRILEGIDPENIQYSLNKVAKQQYAKQQIKLSFKLQALDDIVPGPQLYDSLGQTWDYLSLFLTGLITLVVLVPACSNYINLSISQSLERMREIGVRKVFGAQKEQIFLQFIVESTTIVLVALLLSGMIYEIIRTDFISQMVETSPIDLSPTWVTFLGFLLFAVLVGIIAGIVPALYFSRLSPVNALKGKEVKTSGRSLFRKVVLTTQFMLSLGFIMAVVIMLRQYQYSVNYDFGFDQANVLDVELQNVDPQIFKNEYGKVPSVKRISMSSHLLGIEPGPERQLQFLHQEDSIGAFSISVDEAFISNMKLKLLAGNDFTQDKAGNAKQIIVNEEFVKKLKLTEPSAAIGRWFVLPEGKAVRIGGVLKSFHFADLKEEITPFFFEYNPDTFHFANLKLETSDVAGSLTAMETLWKRIGGEGKFTAQLFSQEIKSAYDFYIMVMKLWGFLGLLAITVACLGLLGTVSFTIKKRYKEISIRKVMGASSESLVLLLSKDFFILMVIASAITIPVMYFMFTHLLATTQHYSIEIGFLEIFISVMIMMILGLATILSQTLKAANANPVEFLRAE
ncbi:ABC transporter permease [Rufibacter roseolus]|uniref:ABC transporter permease n=1 Tax=Rufibacter roseolus TaxID=2817375 RepID=UPI001B31135F|nr:ABC transporter permease [Rufibacter roseolus]